MNQEAESLGHPVVDRVVASLASLDELGVSDHVGVFEATHDDLRRLLVDAGEHQASA